MKKRSRILGTRTKRPAVLASLSVVFLLGVSLAAQDVQLPLKAIEVTHFTQTEGLGLSQDFINSFYDGLSAELPKTKIAGQVVEEGGTVPDADAANSVVVEGKFLEKKSGFVGIVRAEINLYRLSDHTLILTITPKVPYKPSPLNNDKTIGHATGRRTAYEMQRALKKK
jgi:hypothetical protein